MKSRNNGDFRSPGTPDSPTTKKKQRRGSTNPGSGTPPAMHSSPMPELVPPPPSSGDTVHISNPFDDMPCSRPPIRPSPGPPGPPPHPGMMGGGGLPPGPGPRGGPGPPQFHPHHGPPPHGHGGPPMRMPMGMGGYPPPPPHGHGPPPPQPMPPPMHSGKIYPEGQPMIQNPQNSNAPPIYPCGVCRREVHDNDQAIACESGCNFFFHRACTGLSEAAFYYLSHEVYAEWVCDNCLTNKNIPPVKFKP